MGLLGNQLPLVRRIGAALRRGRLDDELREEIADHIERRRGELIDEGMDPRDAAFEARRLFGNAAAIRERTREMRSFRPLDALAQDVRFGLRVLRRTPVFSAVAIVSLALGIGAAVAVFTVADAVLFRALAVRQSGDLRAFQVEIRMGASSKIVPGVPERSLAAIQQGADFADFVGFRISDEVAAGVDNGGASQPTRVEFVSTNYFDVLGVPTALGRLLGPQDERSAQTPIVISERLWRARFNQDPGVLGRTISLNGRPTVIVGVTRRFSGLVAERASDVFAPLRESSIDPTQGNFVVTLVGRLHPGVPVAVAEQKLASLYRVSMPGPKGAELHATLEDASRGVSSARDALEKPLRLGLLLVAVLVLVACANTGGLLLSRFVSRQGEFGVRLAIGAGRGRLARQLAVEAFLVSAAAGGIGLFLGWLAAPLFMAIMPETGSRIAFELRFDLRLVLFTIAVTVLCAGGAAAASLLRLWGSDPSALLNTDSRTVAAGSRRITRVLISAQVAASLLLVIGAVSMARTLLNLQRVPLGFDSNRTFVVSVNATGLAPAPEVSAYHARLHERIQASPGVARASMAQIGVLTSSATVGTVDVAGFVPSSDEDRISRVFFVGPDYFETLGMPIVAGRGLLPEDEGMHGTRAVVNERFARFYFGTPADAIDRVFNRDVRIVGVVADAHYNTPREEASRTMFIPYGSAGRSSMAHIVRVTDDPAAGMRRVRDVIAAYDPRLRPRFATIDELMATSLARERFFAVIAWVLSSLALLLACAGLHAAVAYAVSQRRGELAVRLALGASSRDVVSLILRDPLTTTLIGIAAGVPAAYAVMRSATSLLFGVAPFDVPTIVISAAGLVAAALIAAAWPARRALTIDPVAALRSS
jgi:predicted permease